MAQLEIAPERILMRKTMIGVCAKYPAWAALSAETQEALVRRMERNCFETTITGCKLDGIDRLFTEPKFVNRYSTTCSRILANLDVTGSVGSDYLIDNIVREIINPYNIAELTSQHLCPDASKHERNEIELRQKQRIQSKVSHAYTCRKCGGKETIPIEFQGLAVDEGMRTSIKCINCEFVWRK